MDAHDTAIYRPLLTPNSERSQGFASATMQDGRLHDMLGQASAQRAHTPGKWVWAM